MSAFTVCMTHRRFYPCVSHVRSTCRWSSDVMDTWEVCVHILSTTPQERINELRSTPESPTP